MDAAVFLVGKPHYRDLKSLHQLLGVLVHQGCHVVSWGVGDNCPVLGRHCDLNLKGCTDRGLVEAREPSVAIEWLKMRVDVDLIVRRVCVLMKPCAVSDVTVLERDFYNVRPIDFEQRQRLPILRDTLGQKDSVF